MFLKVFGVQKSLFVQVGVLPLFHPVLLAKFFPQADIQLSSAVQVSIYLSYSSYLFVYFQ